MSRQAISESALLNLKKEAERGRDTYVKEEATKQEVLRNIEKDKESIRALGYDPETAAAKIQEEEEALEVEFNRIYDEIKAIAPASPARGGF